MNDFTPEQKKQLASWVSQRDAILIDIGNKKTEKEKLIVEVADLAVSKTQISNDIQQSIGRLKELDRQEINRATFVLRDVAKLDDQKGILQAEVTSLRSEVATLVTTKIGLNADIESIIKIHEVIFSKAGDIERIVGSTVQINSQNAREIVNILTEAKTQLKEVIDIGKENVAVTNKAIQAIPKIIVDLHRNVIERRNIPRAKLPN